METLKGIGYGLLAIAAVIVFFTVSGALAALTLLATIILTIVAIVAFIAYAIKDFIESKSTETKK